MDRLTQRDITGIPFCQNAGYLDMLQRLVAYEDTGLEPEECKTLYNIISKLSGELAKYKEAEVEGRLIVLPCKEGTPIWKLSPRLNSAPVIEERFYNVAYDQHLKFGKDFFLSREEAEAALGGAKDDKT